jgi:hypothetical protein
MSAVLSLTNKLLHVQLVIRSWGHQLVILVVPLTPMPVSLNTVMNRIVLILCALFAMWIQL